MPLSILIGTVLLSESVGRDRAPLQERHRPGGRSKTNKRPKLTVSYTWKTYSILQHKTNIISVKIT